MPVLFACPLPLLAQAPAAPSQDPGGIEYPVHKGDTLIAIGRSMLEEPRDWAAVQRLNHVTNPYRLRPGQLLRIPNELLKSEPSVARVVSVSGTAQVDGQPLAAGQTVGEAAVVQTDADSVITLRLADGSTLRIAPASRLRFERLRRYHSDLIVEARIALERGRVETSATTSRRKPIEVRSTVATAAVRGTDFRVSGEAGFTSAEVLSGSVGFASNVPPKGARPQALALEAGYGSAADGSGRVSAPEALLPAPNLENVPARVEVAAPTFAFPPVDGARAYRIQVARDPAFSVVLSERTSDQPAGAFASAEDGVHLVRVRPISASRIEGRDATRAVDVQARPFAPFVSGPRDGATAFEPAADLQWSSQTGIPAYRVQLASDAAFGNVLRNERVTTSGARVELAVAGTEPVTRFWRVASIDETGKTGPFGPAQRIVWQPSPPPPQAAASGPDEARLAWRALPGQRYDIEIARDPAFSGAVRRERAEGGEFVIRGLAPGRHYARIRARTPDGTTSPFTPSQGFDIPVAVTDGTGHGVTTGSGTPLHSPQP
jgi:hypothetical protein